MKIKNLSNCGLCTKGNPSTHLIITESKKSCPHNGANAIMYTACDECLAEEVLHLKGKKREYKNIKVMKIIQGVYSDGLKTLEI